MQEQIDRIKTKFRLLKRLDRRLDVFGADDHYYELDPPVAAGVIADFEKKYGIQLPAGYTAFITGVCNGIAGPFYGLEPFEKALVNDLDHDDSGSPLNPAAPFLYTEPWEPVFNATVTQEENEEEYRRQYDAFYDHYFDKAHLDGTIAICNYGCGVVLYLVVNGPEYGHVWTDDRCNGGGIYPSEELENTGRINFLDWYELWLDSSLKEIEMVRAHKKPWWKIW